MTLVALAQAQIDAYLAWRVNPADPAKRASPLYTALVSDLADGDFLVGPRAVVQGTPTVSSTNRIITATRLGQTLTLTWPAAQTVIIQR